MKELIVTISRFHTFIPALVLLSSVACTVAETEDGIDYEFVEVGQGHSIDPALAPGLGERPPMLRVLLTDAPANVDAVFVTIDQTLVQICEDENCASSDWVDVMDEPVTLDLLTLQGGDTVELAAAELPAGSHGEIQLVLSDVTLVIDGEELSLEVPPTSPRIDDGFDLEVGMMTEVTLDFDAEASLVRWHDGWMLRPVVSMIAETMLPL
jgi:hypothetical protein